MDKKTEKERVNKKLSDANEEVEKLTQELKDQEQVVKKESQKYDQIRGLLILARQKKAIREDDLKELE